MAGKGDRYERRLRTIFQYGGYGCIRLAASGGGFDDDLPDLFVGRPERRFALELKYSSEKDNWNYVPKEEQEQLIAFAEQWGAEPAWAARFPQDTQWYFYPAEAMQTTEKSVKWRYEECRENWFTLDYFDLVPYSDVPDDFTPGDV